MGDGRDEVVLLADERHLGPHVVPQARQCERNGQSDRCDDADVDGVQLADSLRDPGRVDFRKVQGQIAEAEGEDSCIGRFAFGVARRLSYRLGLRELERHAVPHGPLGGFLHLRDELPFIKLESLEKSPVFDLHVPQQKDLAAEDRRFLARNNKRYERLHPDLNHLRGRASVLRIDGLRRKRRSHLVLVCLGLHGIGQRVELFPGRTGGFHGASWIERCGCRRLWAARPRPRRGLHDTELGLLRLNRLSIIRFHERTLLGEGLGLLCLFQALDRIGFAAAALGFRHLRCRRCGTACIGFDRGRRNRPAFRLSVDRPHGRSVQSGTDRRNDVPAKVGHVALRLTSQFVLLDGRRRLA